MWIADGGVGRSAGLPGGVPRSSGGRAPGVGLARPDGGGEKRADGAAGGAVAPGRIRAGLPRGVGTAPAGLPPAAGGLAPTAGAALPPGRAAARVGGGTLFGFSFLIFCSSSALLGTPFQPCSTFGCATLAFTFGGAIVGGALAILGGAATRSLLPCTLVSAPDLTAADKSAAGCRSMVSR